MRCTQLHFVKNLAGISFNTALSADKNQRLKVNVWNFGSTALFLRSQLLKIVNMVSSPSGWAGLCKSPYSGSNPLETSPKCFILKTLMATTADLRIGAVIKYNNDLCTVLESEHRTPGNLRAFYQVKMRNMRTGKLLENRFRSGETIEFVRVDRKNYQYLYKDGESFMFMDVDTYDQIPVDADIVGDAAKFMKEGQEAQLALNDMTVLSVEIPTHVNLRVVSTEPGLRGDTATNVLKPATLETGAIIGVPIFVNEGDMLRIDTRTSSYMERVKE